MQRCVEWIARVMALAGGLVLLALVLLVCLSVLGRGAGGIGHGAAADLPGLAGLLRALGPIRGDFELVEAGIAFAVFAFLPLTQLMGGHASVSIFSAAMGRRSDRVLRAFWEVVLALVVAFIAWRLLEGTQDKFRNGQTTFLIQFPVWWAYAAASVAAGVAVAVACWCAFARIAGLVTGHDPLPAEDGAPQ